TKAATEFVLTAVIADILLFRVIREILRCSYPSACSLTSRKKCMPPMHFLHDLFLPFFPVFYGENDMF
ncbi:MAG: hypothetical protein EBW44_03090, partial [Rhodobacteraceae bacterium]|nr:hypothetical protein [Paracoccaceae bacterium]